MRTTKTNDGIADVILRKLTRRRNAKQNELDFTPEQEEYFQKLVFIDNLFRQHYPILGQYQIFKLYSARYDHSKTQFYKDVRNCQKVFGTLHTVNKDFKRLIYTEWLEKCVGLGFAQGDLKAVRESIKIAAELNQLHLLDKEEGDEKPAKLVINMAFGVGGNPVEKVMSIDEFQSMDDGEFQKFLEMTDRPRVGVEEMEKMLLKDEGEDTE